MKITRLEYEANSIRIEGMSRQDWENFRDGIMNYGNAECSSLFRFIAGAPGEFIADCVGNIEQENHTTAMMSWVEEEFLSELGKEPVVYILGHFWDRFVYLVITQTEDYSDQTREMISKDIPQQGFWPVVDRILEAL